VRRPVRPHAFEATALLEHLDRRGDPAAVLFEEPENLLGRPSPFGLVSNVFATRERIAEAIGHSRGEAGLPLSLEMARRERLSVPATTCAGQAPVQEQVWKGEEADVRQLPLVRHYEKDLGPVITMAIGLKDPDEGFYEISFAKTFYRDHPTRLGVSIHTPHLERVLAKYWKAGRAAPAINILGHHPAFFLGVLAATPFGTNDYDTVGAYLGEPLRLAPSITWGSDFLVPADAEIVLEGEIPPGEPCVVDPFGEVTRFYQPQCVRQTFHVKAVTGRRNGILQDIFSGHQGHWNMSAIPKEGSIYNLLQQRFGNVVAVHMPHSLCSRLGCYVSIRKGKEGIAKQVGHAALLESFMFQWIVVVDEDIDVFNEKEVLWALASYTDPSRDVDLVKNSFTPFNAAAGYQKVVVDATRPLDYPFPERFRVPESVMDAIRPEDWFETS
jgi:UbiD family decarboxylase